MPSTPAGQKPAKFTLMDLICGMIYHAATQGVKNFPSFHSSMWHKLLYALQRDPESHELLPDLIGEFRHGGQYAKNTNFQNIVAKLTHISDKTLSKFPRMVLKADLAPTHYEQKQAKAMIIDAYDLACKIPEFFER